ncbi:MAG: hypothetical protein FGM37_04980 [Phycisphaerales bacterium]|nr:hypothetical protein [Phycisphaerales bacterium]
MRMRFVAVAALAALLPLPLLALTPQDRAPKGSPYTLATCIVSGKALPEKPFILVYSNDKDPIDDGREIRFCCGTCAATFQKDPKPYLSKIDAAMVEQQLAHFPAGNCPVMADEPLPDPRGPEAKDADNIIVGNQLVRVCCGKCVRKVKGDPERFMRGAERAIIKAQSKDYPLSTCPISGKPIEGAGHEFVIASRLVRTCCPDCETAVRADPLPTFAKIDAAAKAKSDSAPAGASKPSTPTAPKAPAQEPAGKSTPAGSGS